MIAFLPVVALRELNGKVARDNLLDATKDLSSIDAMIAGVFYRFASDKTCPAILLNRPEKGDELIPGMIYIEDISTKHIDDIAEAMFKHAEEHNYGTSEISMNNVNDVLVYMKNDFSWGEWGDYNYEYSGKDGVSIPS